MKKLFLDIETIPADKSQHSLLKEIHRHKLERGSRVPEDFAEYLAMTNLDGTFGQIACISYAFNHEIPHTLSGDEAQILRDFWAIAKSADLFIGFNVIDFDLRFIYQRSVILGVKPSRFLNFARYRSDPIFDVMWEWGKWGSPHISLDILAKALGLPSSKGGEVEGKNVAQAYKDGKIKQICEYCERDVEVTRKIYHRITFSSST